VERRAGDVTFLAAYTYSKAIDDASGFNDWVNFTNYRLSRSLSAYDIPNNFVVSYNWAVPLNRWVGGAPRRLTNGWNLVGISRFAQGFPVGLSEGGLDISLVGSPSTDVPNVVGKVQIENPRNVAANGNNYYFLPSAFAAQAPGTFGDANRRFFHGPGILNTDFAFEKTTAITERTSIQVRAEFFNIFNHTQFNGPNGNFSASNFGAVTSARDPRIGQVSARFTF